MGLRFIVAWLFSSPPQHQPKHRQTREVHRARRAAHPPPAGDRASVQRSERERRTAALNAAACQHGKAVLKGRAYVVDGDTIIVNKVNIRLAGIDAPELDHPWGQKSKWAVVAMTKGQTITAHVTQEMSYDRVVATCFLPDGRDLAAELVKQGLAIDWPKYSGGKYRALEPTGIRKKLWRADARQKGRWPC